MWVANKTQLSRFGVLGKETRELSIGTTSPKLFLLGGSGQATTGTCSMFFFIMMPRSSSVLESSHVLKYLRYLTIVLRPADPQRFINN